MRATHDTFESRIDGYSNSQNFNAKGLIRANQRLKQHNDYLENVLKSLQFSYETLTSEVKEIHELLCKIYQGGITNERE